MYGITEVARICGITAHTLRFYDKEGLLPFISRSDSGKRIFLEQDLEILKIIVCLKNTGMPLKRIKLYVDMVMEGAPTVEQRREMIKSQRIEVGRQLEELRKNLSILDMKMKFYDALNHADSASAK